MLGLVGTAATLFAVQVIVGALQIWTQLAPWAVSLHLALGAAIWGLLVTATLRGLVSRRVPTCPWMAPAMPGTARIGRPVGDAAARPRCATASAPTSR